MPRSMTGFGRGVRETPDGQIVVEIRAVNARFSEARVRLPADASALEMRLREQIKARIARGKIDCTVRLEAAPGARAATIDAETLRATCDALHTAVANLPIEGGITLDALLRAVPRDSAGAERWRDEAFQAEVTAAVADALDTLDAARATEGAKTVEFLKGQLDQIEAAMTEVCALAPQVVERYGEKLRQRLEDLERTQSIAADPGRVEQELVLFAQRVDVTEETDRLGAHCEAFHALLKSDKPVGRRMDFLVQEILREVNTIGSKAKDVGVLGQVVDLKVVAEQMREQIQNVE